MKDSQGISVLKTLYEKLLICCNILPDKYKKLDIEIERKLIDINRSYCYSNGQSSFKSIDSIILKFPQFREGLKEIRDIFEQYDEDLKGTIGNIEKLKNCLDALRFGEREEQIHDILCYCNIDENKGIQLNEFIVLLCLIYLLNDSSNKTESENDNYSPEVENTFNGMIEVFLFFDKNCDGKLKKKEVVKAFNEASPREKSPRYVTRNRFKEMDCNRDGKVSFKEFLFSFINWIGIDSEDDSPINK